MSQNQLIYAMLSDRGRVRRRNEDACAASPEAGVYVVCDGMGGAAAGEIASDLAAKTLLENLTANRKPGEKPEARLGAAIQAANRAVYGESRQSARLAGMGTTLVALLHAPVANGSKGQRRHANSRSSDPATLWLAHVGDSRCYRWRRGRLERLTEDHSLVEEQVRAGQMTRAQALRSPMRNLITRAIGSQALVEPEIQGHRPQPGDLYLLASDGLMHELEDDEIAQVLDGVAVPYTKAGLRRGCDALVRAANSSGGNDNVTVLLVGVEA